MLNIKNSISTKGVKKYNEVSKSNEKLIKTVVHVRRKKSKPKKRKRLIIRNLSFKASEEDLKEIFSKYGNVIGVNIPLKQDGKKRGFAFIEFEDTKSLIQAMKNMNYKEIHGRKVAIDFAIDKNSYESKLQSLKKKTDSSLIKKEIKTEPDSSDEIKSEEDSDSGVEELDEEGDEENKSKEDEEEKKLKTFLKDFYSGADELTNSKTVKNDECSSESSDEESNEDEDEEEDDDKKGIKKKFLSDKKIKQEFDEDGKPSKNQKAKKTDSKDISEGKTVFLRNIAFTTTEESLRDAMEEYGECIYSLLCMDPLTDHPKGTAFVKFKEKANADKLIEKSYVEPGVIVDGRKLICSLAISREDASLIGKTEKTKSDKRNLNLLRVGLIMPDSEESEGISKSDMAKRSQLEIIKKQKLRNVNFFVSDKRLLIHNLPRDYTDNKLRQLFKKAAGHGAVLTEVRVMKEFKKTDATGLPLSKGYGFVSFDKHEDALRALNELNNNPNIFTSNKRPIVEFSIENKVALLSKEKRKEKIQLRNKRRSEEKMERKLNQSLDSTKTESETLSKGKKRKNKKKQTQENKKRKLNESINNEISKEKEAAPKEKKKKNRRKSRSKKDTGVLNRNMSDMKNMYMNQLSNKT
ncbi:RNA-binding protein 28 [Caerostris darwini]|uniref:RNA-binding protein 28 n=1 Tax=Caerostris darwini TaxID=1538125 RepID=A0AAV4PWH9_9ARAC|nr:RNA-binding protein 28 [Caerostris darwini]